MNENQRIGAAIDLRVRQLNLPGRMEQSYGNTAA
jgi:hypothetical protein